MSAWGCCMYPAGTPGKCWGCVDAIPAEERMILTCNYHNKGMFWAVPIHNDLAISTSGSQITFFYPGAKRWLNFFFSCEMEKFCQETRTTHNKCHCTRH